MQPNKSVKIDIHSDYPCPCRRRGRLVNIVLTEAFGCDRCQRIFVLQENGQVIEQLAATYPYKQLWRWTGYRWVSAENRFNDSVLSLILGAILLLVFVAVPLGLRYSASVSMIFWIGITLSLVILSGFLFWLASRR